MADFISLTCPTCGGKLQITPDLDRFACAHCGNEHMVKRSEGVVALQPLTESLTGLRQATDRTASELAIRRLTDDLVQLQAARQEVEGMAAGHRRVIATHNSKRLGCQSAIIGLVLTPLCFVVSSVVTYLTQGQPEGSYLSLFSVAMLLTAGIFGLMTAGFFLKWLFSSDPTPARKVAEENLRATGAEISSLTERMAQKQAEIGQHQQRVALGG